MLKTSGKSNQIVGQEHIVAMKGVVHESIALSLRALQAI